MKILILGGYGTFGGRLARMLVSDGHEVTIAGRNLRKAEDFCVQHGGIAAEIDRASDLAVAFALHGPQIVVDAAGPFQTYKDDPYRVARAALEAGAHYLDFSDDAAFTTGISELDALAKTNNLVALSGASSVPALSSAAVANLAEELCDITLIENTILPGNRAPRGRSVMEAILSQVGNPIRLWRGGKWREGRGWSDSRPVQICGETRHAALIGCPDLRLFPAYFKARSVLFRAGLELGLMHNGLRLLSRLRWLIAPEKLLGPLLWIANRLERFGSDTGGMIVQVSGRTQEGKAERREWVLEVVAGDGPFIPAIPARLLIDQWHNAMPNAGARPCLCEFTLTEAEEILAKLQTTMNQTTTAVPRLFEIALGVDWQAMPLCFRDMHDVWDVQSATGEASVARGSSLLSWMISTIFGFPRSAKSVPVKVTMQSVGDQEIWQRDFAGHRFKSRLAPAGPGAFCESFGPFTFEMDLPVEDGRLSMPVRKGWFLGIPVPHSMLPRSETQEFERDGKFHFDVRLSAPLAGLLVHYKGWLIPDREPLP